MSGSAEGEARPRERINSGGEYKNCGLVVRCGAAAGFVLSLLPLSAHAATHARPALSASRFCPAGPVASPCCCGTPVPHLTDGRLGLRRGGKSVGATGFRSSGHEFRNSQTGSEFPEMLGSWAVAWSAAACSFSERTTYR